MWRDPSDARVAKLLVGTGVTGSCSAVPLAGKWLLSARHCLYAPEPKPGETTYGDKSPTKYPDGAPRFIRNTPATGGLGINGDDHREPLISDGHKVPSPTSAGWVAVPHPTRDLVLLHRWPLTNDVPSLPLLVADPPMSSQPILPAAPSRAADVIDSVIGFGCTGDKTSPGNDMTAREGQMLVDRAGTRTLSATGNHTWSVRLLPLPLPNDNSPDYLAGGDSGGPARMTREFPFKAGGSGPATQVQLVGIVATSEMTGPEPKTCPWPEGLALASHVTTFEVPTNKTAAATVGPGPIEWLHAQRTRLGGLPPLPKGLGGIIIQQPPGPAAVPSVAWTDLDGDGVSDLYTWGEAGLRVAKNAGNEALGIERTLLATLPPALLGVAPVMGDLNGDKIGDLVVLSPTGLSIAYGQDLFSGATNALGALNSVGLDVFTPFAVALAAAGVSAPKLQALPRGDGTSSVVMLVDPPAGSPLLYNAMFLNPGGAPGVGFVPALNVARGNYTFAQMDGSGRPYLLVTDEAAASTPNPAATKTYFFDNENGAAALYQVAVATGVPLVLPTDCPMPDNLIRFADVDQDGTQDLVCIRPYTIEVYRGLGALGAFGPVVASPFSVVQSSDPDRQGTDTEPFFPWTTASHLADVTGDGRPDFVNRAFADQLWYRANLGGGKFGPFALLDLPAAYPTAALDRALDATPLPAPPSATNRASTFAFSNGNPSGTPGGQTVAMLSFPYQELDHDGDGVADLLDNCALLPNPDQADANQDGVGDLCDNTKCGTDADGDKITDVVTSDDPSCLGTVTDNCIGIANSDQRNGNLDAELANNAQILGDACDPVPHGAPVLTWGTTSTPTNAKCGTPDDGPTVCIQEGLGYRSVAGFQVRTIGSHEPALGGGAKSVETSVVVPRTSYRFCLEDGSQTEASVCTDPIPLGADQPLDSSSPPRGAEAFPTAASAWLRISASGLTNPTGPNGSYLGPKGKGQSFVSGTDFGAGWSWSADLSAWSAAFNVAGQPARVGSGTGARGALAVHAETSVGATSAGGAAFHPLLDDPSTPATHLSVAATAVDALSHAVLRLLPTPNQWRVRPSPLLVSWVPVSASACASQPGGLCRAVTPGTAVPIYRHPVTDFVGVVDEDGAIREEPEALPLTVRTVFSSPRVVLSPSEPGTPLHRVGAPTVVTLSPNLGAVQSTIKLTRGVLREVAAPCTAEAGCPGTIALRGAAPPAAAANAAASDDREGAVAVYSAALERVFRIRSGGSNVPEIASHAAAAGGAWTTRTMTPGSLGRVIDATYHVFDGMLWVLDDIGQGSGRSLRLLRVSPFDGSVDEVARFPARGVFDTYWLRSDHDGHLLLAASGGTARRHTLVRFHVADMSEWDTPGAQGELRVDGVYSDKGELVAPPQVSEQDLAILVQRGKDDVPEVVRFSGFPGKKGGPSDWGGLF